MINPGEIPQIPGDMDALAGHASALQSVGRGFTDTGADVHATWQRLTPVYIAPESGQLLQATVPVQQVSARIGSNLEAVGAALSTYAQTVKPIKARLESLRAQAQTFVGSVEGDDDWRENEDKVNQNNQLLSQVHQAIDDWMTAQRTCANAINALYGGTHYVADNADGHQAPNEFGFSAKQLNSAAVSDQGLPWGKMEEEDNGNIFSTIGHGILDGAGLIPGFGEIADGINAAWYLAEGDKTNAALSAAGMVPFLGWGATGTKFVSKGNKALKGLDESADATKGTKGVDGGSVSGKANSGGTPPPRQFVTTPRGTTFDIPAGWQSRPADNGKGIVFQRPGATGNADSIRVMEPTSQYPNGYFRYYNSSGQPLDINGNPGPRSATHIPESFSGIIKGWPK